LILALLAVAGCRPSEPPPSYNEDLGTQESVLLPTSSAWYDPAVAKGQADWRPFRKPGSEAKSGEVATGEAKPAGGNPGVESDLRGLVNDFNAAVAAGKFDEAIDFLVEEQAAPAKQVVEFLPKLADKLKEVAEVLPGDNENFKKAVAVVSPAAMLKLDIVAITVLSPTEATGKFAPRGGGVGDVRFVLVKDGEEYWYINHPEVSVLIAELPALQQSLLQLDAFIAGVKSGQISGEVLAQQAAAMDQMIGAMLPSASQHGTEPAKDELEKDAKPEGGSGG